MGRSVQGLRKTRRNNKKSKRFLNKNKNKRSMRGLRKRTRKRKFLGGTGEGDGAAKPAAAEPAATKPACPISRTGRRQAVKVKRTVGDQREVLGDPLPLPPTPPPIDEDEPLPPPPAIPRELEGTHASLEDLGMELYDEISEELREARKSFKTKPEATDKLKKNIKCLIVTLTAIKDNNTSDAFFRKFQYYFGSNYCKTEYVLKIDLMTFYKNFVYIINTYNFDPYLLVIFTGHGGKGMNELSGDTKKTGATAASECEEGSISEGFLLDSKEMRGVQDRYDRYYTTLNQNGKAGIGMLFALLNDLHNGKEESGFDIIFYVCRGSNDEDGKKGFCNLSFPQDTTLYSFLKNSRLYCNKYKVPRFSGKLYGTEPEPEPGLEGMVLAEPKVDPNVKLYVLNKFFTTEFEGDNAFDWTLYDYTSEGNTLNMYKLPKVNTLQGLLDEIYG